MKTRPALLLAAASLLWGQLASADDENPPVRTYRTQLFTAKCINYQGEAVTVETYAHNMAKVIHDVPAFMKKHIAPEICCDLTIGGMKFFRARAAPLFAEMLRLASSGTTVYPRSLYSKHFLETLRNI